jgi:hypothetical protein
MEWWSGGLVEWWARSFDRHEMAKQNSPGLQPRLQPWVRPINGSRPESISSPAHAGCNTDRAHRSNSSPINYEQTLSRTRTTTRTRTMCLTSARHEACSIPDVAFVKGNSMAFHDFPNGNPGSSTCLPRRHKFRSGSPLTVDLVFDLLWEKSRQRGDE